jgi:hypothetical protein
MILYNSKAIIPGPLLEIRRETVRSEAGYPMRRVWVIQAKGSLMAWKGRQIHKGFFGLVVIRRVHQMN